MSIILGLNAFHPGASAAIVVDGKVVVAIAEERLSRVKDDESFPKRAIRECLNYAGLSLEDIEAIAIGSNPATNRYQKIAYALKQPTRLRNLLGIKQRQRQLDDLRALVAEACDLGPDRLKSQIYRIEHHLAHTASAYFISGWDHASGLTLDGSGDFVSCMLSECRGNQITVKQRICVPIL